MDAVHDSALCVWAQSCSQALCAIFRCAWLMGWRSGTAGGAEACGVRKLAHPRGTFELNAVAAKRTQQLA